MLTELAALALVMDAFICLLFLFIEKTPKSLYLQEGTLVPSFLYPIVPFLLSRGSDSLAKLAGVKAYDSAFCEEVTEQKRGTIVSSLNTGALASTR